MLSSGQIVAIVIFFLYILASSIGFYVMFLLGRAYLDLAKGLHKIIKRAEEEGKLDYVEEMAVEISKYYESYTKYNPSVKRRYGTIISWLDDILLQTNMFTKGPKRKIGIWFDEYYDVVKKIQQCFEKQHPFYQCSETQAQILLDIQGMKNEDNELLVDNLLTRTQTEFIQQTVDNKKNAMIYISLAIGIAGILVSVLLTVLQVIG